MDFNLSDEQRALQETARKFAREVIRPKAAHYDEVAEFPVEIFSQAFELGLLNLTVPQEFGGAGVAHVDQTIITEEISWGCAGVAASMVANDLALLPIVLAANEDQKKRLLAPLTETLRFAS